MFYSLNAMIKEFKGDLQKVQMEMKAEVIKYEEAKKNGSKFEVMVQELSRQLEQAKQQGKNNSVLELEIKNYEVLKKQYLKFFISNSILIIR